MAAGSKVCAKERASARIRRPSASVLMISTVFPARVRTTSPGFTALPDGRFSEDGTMPTTFRGGESSPMALIAPMTAAPPDMSNFMSSIFAAGLMEMPPASKVSPFPTSTNGGSPSPPPRCSSTIRRGSWTDP